MHETGKQLLNLMFRPGETVCVSPNKYGYHSIPLDNALQDSVKLLSTQYREGKPLDECLRDYPGDTIQLCALNPIEGWREDRHCKAFRNFLVEVDYGPLAQQLEYIKQLKMPYSAVIFSGNKSLHFLISLDTDLPSEKIYRLFSRWILAVATLADDKTFNPSRSIRVPGAKRDDKKQLLVEFKGQVKLDDLKNWLMNYMDVMPKDVQKKPVSENPDFDKIPKWVVDKLTNGVDRSRGRNYEWFVIGCKFAVAGYSEDDTLNILSSYFQEEHDFKEREWKGAIRSAFKNVYENGDTYE